MYGGKFDLLGKEQQLVVLRAMLELRRKKADALYEMYKSNDFEKNKVVQEILGRPVELNVNLVDKTDNMYRQKISVRGIVTEREVNSQDITGYATTTTFKEATLDFSTDDKFAKSLEVMASGIESSSEIARFLAEHGAKMTEGVHSEGFFGRKKTAISKFQDTPETRGAIRKYMEYKAAQTNAATRTAVVKNAFARGMAKLQHGGAVFGLETPRSRYEQEVVRSQVADIMQSQRTDVEKMQELKKLVGGKFEASEKLQENLMAVIDGAFRGPDGAILINSGEREIGDLEGGR